MPRKCTVCNRQDRADIEIALVGGESFRNIAKRFAVSSTALLRHKRHLLPEIVQSKVASDLARTESVVGRIQDQVAHLERLDKEAMRVLREAKDNPDRVLRAIRESANLNREKRATYQAIAELTGELTRGQQQPSTTVQMVVLPCLPGGGGQAPPVLPAADAVFIPTPDPPGDDDENSGDNRS